MSESLKKSFEWVKSWVLWNPEVFNSFQSNEWYYKVAIMRNMTDIKEALKCSKGERFDFDFNVMRRSNNWLQELNMYLLLYI